MNRSTLFLLFLLPINALCPVPAVVHITACTTGLLSACYRWHLHNKTSGMDTRRKHIFNNLLLAAPLNSRQRANLIGHMEDIKKYQRSLKNRTTLTNISLLIHLFYAGYYLGRLHK